MRLFESKWVFLAALLVAGGASAQNVEVSEPVVRRAQAWSIYSGYTLGPDNTALGVQVGWPGISARLLHGVTRELDLGGRFAFNYGFEGIVTDLEPSIRLQGMARLNLLDRPKLGLALEFAPGPVFYFDRITQFGMTLPVELVLGIPVGSAILINAGVEVPLVILFGSASRVVIPILFGGGVEYFIDRDLAATFGVRMGPAIQTRNRDAEFALEALLGIAYRF